MYIWAECPLYDLHEASTELCFICIPWGAESVSVCGLCIRTDCFLWECIQPKFDAAPTVQLLHDLGMWKKSAIMMVEKKKNSWG